MGILYNDEDVAQDPESNAISCDIPVSSSVPLFSLRQGKPRRSRRRLIRRSLPLRLSFSDLSQDVEIMHFLSSSTSHTPMIQHHNIPPLTDIQQSLPPTPASASASASASLSSSLPFPATISVISRPHPRSLSRTISDWTFISTPRHNLHPTTTTPSSDPEPWILVDDS